MANSDAGGTLCLVLIKSREKTIKTTHIHPSMHRCGIGIGIGIESARDFITHCAPCNNSKNTLQYIIIIKMFYNDVYHPACAAFTFLGYPATLTGLMIPHSKCLDAQINSRKNSPAMLSSWHFHFNRKHL